jgi:hypothetical protein
MFLLAVLDRVQVFCFSFTAVAGGLVAVSLAVADIKADAYQTQSAFVIGSPR